MTVKRHDPQANGAPLVAGLGEVLWDIFPDGPRLGGATANFACMAAALAPGVVHAAMVSAVGRDDLGARARAEFDARGVDTTCLADRDEVTGQVLVTLDASGAGSYRFLDNTAWDHLEWSPPIENMARRVQAVCFGSLAQRGRTTREFVGRFLAAAPASSLRVFDVNLRPPHWTPEVIRESLSMANVVKLNDDELPVVAECLGLQGAEDGAVLNELMSRFNLRLGALTRGAQGSLLMDASGARSDLPGVAVSIVDSVGAGDAFTAAMVLGLLFDLSLAELHAWASSVAAYVCTQAGATPPIPRNLHLRLPRKPS